MIGSGRVPAIVRWVRRAVPTLLATGALLVVPEAVEGAGPWPRVSVSTFPMPPVPGPVEIRLVIDAGPRAWRGVAAVRSTGAAAQIGLAVPAHGRRAILLPWSVASTGSALVVSIDGATAARVDVSSAEQRGRRLLVRDAHAGAPANPGHADVADLPRTSRAYASFDLVVLPHGSELKLDRAQQAAMERWVRWGGAVGTPDGADSAVMRMIGLGVVIAGSGVETVARAHDRWRHEGLLPVWRRPLAGWDTEAAVPGAARDAAPLTVVGLAVVGYLGALGLTGAVLARFPGARFAGAPVVLLLALLGSVTVWSAARAGSPALLDVEEITLMEAPADGREVEVTGIVRAQARRSGLSRFEVPLEDAAVAESLVRGPVLDERRVIRLDARADEAGAGGQRPARAWERAWALGERATIRVEGTGPALAVHATRRAGGGWEIDNRGRHVLRSAVIATSKGVAHLGDIAPGTRTAAGTPSALRLAADAPAIVRNAVEARRAVLVAHLDPPVVAVDFASDVVARRRTLVVVTLGPDVEAGRP